VRNITAFFAVVALSVNCLAAAGGFKATLPPKSIVVLELK
jgi:hypothetical protein